MRKLACSCLAFSAAVFAADFIMPVKWLPWLAVSLAVLGAVTAALRLKRRCILVLILLAAAFGLMLFYQRDRYIEIRTAPVIGQELAIEGELCSYPTVYEDYCRAELVIQSEGLSGLKAIVYDNSMDIKNAVPGQKLCFTAKIRAADIRYGEDYDYYYSQGIFLILSAGSDISTDGAVFSLRSLPQRISHAIAQKVEELFPTDTVSFIKSLILGDKNGLYNDLGLYVSLSRAGLMHVVAVSGMHIAFLVGFLQLMLGASRRSSLICIVLVWAFVLITGSGYAAVRAGFMQTVFLLAPLLRRENDTITSLSLSLAVILLVNPYAAASISLQLSFSAMAGIVFFGGRLNNGLLSLITSEKTRKALRYPVGILSCSLAVMVFSAPLMALHFGSIPVLSPLTNILCLWAVSVCFCASSVACALGFLAPVLGKAVAFLASWAAKYIFVMAKLVASFRFSSVCLNKGTMAMWLALTYVLIILAVYTKTHLKLKLIIPSLLSLITLTIAIVLSDINYTSGKGVVSVLDVGQGQCVCAFSGSNTIMVDCGSQGSGANAGELAGEYLQRCVRDSVDILVLTHLHSDHCNGVAMLAEMADIGAIYMPDGADDSDEMYAQVLATAEKHGIDVCYLAEDMVLKCGGVEAMLIQSDGAGDVNERGLMVKLTVDDFDVLITGDAAKAAELKLVEEHDLGEVELLVVGHHGSRYSSTGKFLEAVGGTTAIISTGYNNYGHPTNETLERLDAYGYNVYRTDLNKTVEFRVG